MTARGWIKGQPLFIIHGHMGGPPEAPWESLYEERDGGYKTLCRFWKGSKDVAGYGRTRWRGDGMQAHVRAWRMFRGDIPPGLELDHLCGNPWCVNEEHLEPVTHLENIRRGRGPKVTQEQTKEIALDPTSPQRLIAQRYGISLARVEQIKRKHRLDHPTGLG